MKHLNIGRSSIELNETIDNVKNVRDKNVEALTCLNSKRMFLLPMEIDQLN